MTAATVTMIGIAAPIPAAAAAPVAPDGILVSTDGSHYGAIAKDPLFDPSSRIIPGGTQQASIYVRNDSAHNAVVSLHATKISTRTLEFAHLLELAASAPGGVSGTPVRLGDGDCLPLLSRISLPTGATMRLTLDLAMSATAQAEQGQGQRADFDVLVSARDRDKPGMPGAGCATGVSVPGSRGYSPAHGSNGTGGFTAAADLPSTGSELLVPLAGVSALLGAGAALWFVGRRSKRRGRPEPRS